LETACPVAVTVAILCPEGPETVGILGNVKIKTAQHAIGLIIIPAFNGH
jgi:hypothetical protein